MNAQDLPRISIIIPVRNEDKYIARCLQSLLKTEYPPERWEIIIVDGMSTDNTVEEIRRVAVTSPVHIMLLNNPRRITPLSLNMAIRHARGDIIIRVDAHADYEPDYVARCVRVSVETGADNVGGPITTLPGATTAMARAVALLLAHPFGVGNSEFRTNGVVSKGRRDVDTVPFGCFRAEVFHKVGLFDERLERAQDYDFNQRIRRAGGRIVMDPQLRSTYYARPKLRSQAFQGWRTGLWNSYANYINPVNRCFRHLIPAFFSLHLLLSAAFLVWAIMGDFSPWMLLAAVPCWLVSMLYLLVDLLVSTRLARRNGWILWPFLMIAFPAYHFWYGAGLIWGGVLVAFRRFPWQPGDGIPQWEGNGVKEDERLAA